MTYPEGRQPLGADDMAKMHPSTWEAEAKALRARVQELEAALREISTYASSGTAWEPDSCEMCENTLETANAALQKQEGE